VKGPAGVMALVLAETAAGGAALLFLTPLWAEVRRGFFYLTGAVIVVLAGSAAAASAVARDPGAEGGALGVWLATALAGSTLAWLGLLLARQRTVARILGIVTVPLAVAMLFALARTADEPFAVSFLQLLAGAAFTGAVLDGLLLGHWYLTDRKLTRGPIDRMAWILIAAVALEGIALAAGGFGAANEPGSEATGSLNPLLTIGGMASWIGLGMAACTGLIAVFIRLTLRGTRPAAVQSATGFFYLAVITAFTGELAAKVRFLP
jgi:hypothetical protein